MVGWHHQLERYEFEELVVDREVWHSAVHWVAKSQISLSE